MEGISAILAAASRCHAAGEFAEAVFHYRKLVEAGIRVPLLFQNLGAANFALSDWKAARDAFATALELTGDSSDSAKLRLNLGETLGKLGDWNAASREFVRAAQLDPTNAGALALAGLAFHRARDLAAAQEHYRAALKLLPDDAGLWNNLGAAAQESGNPDAAIAAFKRAIELDPSLASAHANLGSALADIGEHKAACDAYARAVELDPANAGAKLGACFAELPILYDDEVQIDLARTAYTEALDRLIATSDPRDPALAAAIGQHHPFYLPYQGRNDAELQRRYGMFASAAMANAYPRWAGPVAMPPREPDGRLRVAFATAYFRNHSVWKLFRGWMEGLDRERFRLMGYWTSPSPDAETPAARACFERFVEGGFEAIASALEADRPHVLIYPELGMDPICHRLAALRFAPVQAFAWGHPETTGFPTIDWFLTSDLMEPPGEAARYTERVERLPGLSIDYAPPEIQATPDPAAFGLRTTATKYLCCQSIFKYLPQDDDLLVRIATRVTHSQFVFVGHPTAPVLAKRFADRVRKAFKTQGLDPARHLVFLPWLDRARYAALNASCDLYLDSLRWSGGNTALEALAQGTPLLTWPGDTMRSRHSYAILKRLGLDDGIATSPEDYVARAVRLGQDEAALAAYTAATRAAVPRLWRDKAPVEALAAFIEREAASAR
jgi:protein O-GlcNAc transferase